MLLILLQHSYCTFVTILFGPLAWLFFNLALRIRALFPKSATTLGLVEQALRRMPLFTECSCASSYEVILAGHRDILPLGLLPLGLRILDAFVSFCRMKEFGDGFDCVIFPSSTLSWRKLQLSPLEHCPLDFPLPTISKNSLYTLFCHLILDHSVPFIISVSGLKILT